MEKNFDDMGENLNDIARTIQVCIWEKMKLEDVFEDIESDIFDIYTIEDSPGNLFIKFTSRIESITLWILLLNSKKEYDKIRKILDFMKRITTRLEDEMNKIY